MESNWPSDRLNSLSANDAYMRNDRMIDPKLRLLHDLTEEERNEASRQLYLSKPVEVVDDCPFGWQDRRTASTSNPHSGQVGPTTTTSAKTSEAAPVSSKKPVLSSSSCSDTSHSHNHSVPVIENPFGSNRHIPPEAPVKKVAADSSIFQQTPSLFSTMVPSVPASTTMVSQRMTELASASAMVQDYDQRIRYIREDMTDFKANHPATYSTMFEYQEMWKLLDHCIATHVFAQKKELLLLEYILSTEKK